METPNTESNNIKETVLSKIDSKEVSMHGKKYFAWKGAAIVALAILTLFLSAFLFNFIFFNIRINAHGYLLSFGPRGFLLFLKLFPWGTLILDILFIGVLEWLLRKFRFGYTVPALYLLAGLLIVAAAIGFAVDRETPLNDQMLHRADMHGLPPPINGIYEGFREPPQSDHDVCNCVVTAIDGSVISAYEENVPSASMLITVPSDDPVLSSLQVGDTIFAAGDFHDDMLHTFGITKTNNSGGVPSSL